MGIPIEPNDHWLIGSAHWKESTPSTLKYLSFINLATFFIFYFWRIVKSCQCISSLHDYNITDIIYQYMSLNKFHHTWSIEIKIKSVILVKYICSMQVLYQNDSCIWLFGVDSSAEPSSRGGDSQDKHMEWAPSGGDVIKAYLKHHRRISFSALLKA